MHLACKLHASRCSGVESSIPEGQQFVKVALVLLRGTLWGKRFDGRREVSPNRLMAYRVRVHSSNHSMMLGQSSTTAENLENYSC